MLFSLALMLLLALGLGSLFTKLKIPGLVAMIGSGIALGPCVLNLISPAVLAISPDLREIALIVILLRAGLTLDIADLKKVGRPAILMSFIPASFEIAAITLIAPRIFGISYLDAAIMGSVLAAVSPAVVVPKMIHLVRDGYGKARNIPQLVMASASVDGIYVIVIFTSFLGMHEGRGFSFLQVLTVPLSIITGMAAGIGCALLLVRLFKIIHMRDTVKAIIILSISFLLVTLDHALKNMFPFSGLLAVAALGGTILKTHQDLAGRMAGKFSKIWIAAEILVFVLVGASINITGISGAILPALLIIAGAFISRIIGVLMCVIKTGLHFREKLFCSLSFLPKATVQAAIGTIPLAAGVAAGNTILTVAVLVILITAPLGAIVIDIASRHLIDQPSQSQVDR
ncbi:MAG: cation:proton antiporter [Spirochaetales bacterium]|nr:cation:proton antiporter [Spirochaetales bacterium]